MSLQMLPFLPVSLMHVYTFLATFYMRAVHLFFDYLFPGKYQITDYISRIKAANERHEVLAALKQMIDVDGAGAWPPNVGHRDSWPAAFRPYHDIFFELAALLPVHHVSSDNTINQSRIVEYRARLQRLLQQQIDITAVESLFSTAEGEDPSLIPAHAYNGLFACISYLRHAFRWGTVPIVKVAQEEKIISFPQELDIPWKFLRRRYGIESQGGCVMSNFYCNVDKAGGFVYHVNSGMPREISSAERNFIYSFVETERQALPIYYHVTQSIICFDNGKKQLCVEHLKVVNKHLRLAAKVYYDQVVDSKIPRHTFVAYLQGFHGWAAGEMVNGTYVEFDGLSGGHIILFNLLDAFLGLDTFLDEESYARYMPVLQREFIGSVKEHGFRSEANQAGDVEIKLQLDDIVRQLRTFRSAHKARTRKYLSIARPERAMMTAGASIIEPGSNANVQDMVNTVDGVLDKKMRETK